MSESRQHEGSQVPLLEMRDITKIFPGVVALSHVNLSIGQG